MWQEKQASLLSEEIEAILTSLANETSFYEILKEALDTNSKLFSLISVNNKPWPLLPLIICEAISGQYDRAIPIAAALQLFTAAGDILDDIEDADSTESIPARHGSSVATNVATTLLILAEKAITRLNIKGVEPYLIIRIIEVVNSLCTIACAGQHLDLSPSTKVIVSEDTYLRITDMKSASTVQCGCHIGALLATSNEELISTFISFGHNLGMASQIANDIQGITRGSDILKRKITLPVIYSLSHADKKTQHQLKQIYNKKSKSVPDMSFTRNLLFNTGGIHYATIKIELYKQMALDILTKATSLGANVEHLKLFLK